jgi:glycosyltransferase involved in cell wall biosynthesis
VNNIVHRFLVKQTIAVSGDVGTSATQLRGVPAGRILVVHNGIEVPPESTTPTDGGTAPNGAFRIGYFGRLSPEKGVDDLLRAVAAVGARHPQLRTWIAGDGPERAALESLAASLGVGEQVEFLGFREDARELMARCDVIVHVPRYEGFGLVLLEAMAAGKAVVTNDAPGGMSEVVVHEETGLIANAGSTESVAGAIIRLIEDPALRMRLGAAARERCEQHFSARVMADRTAEVYHAALNGGHRPAAARAGRRTAE